MCAKVIAAFIIASGLTVIASVVGLVCDLQTPDQPYGKRRVHKNIVNDRCTSLLPGVLSPSNPKKWFDIFRRLILSLSDTQLISGLAVITVAFIQMGSGNLSSYHFNICQDLAWLANNAHVLTMSVVNRWIADINQDGTGRESHGFTVGRYWILRSSRAAVMAIMFTLMLIMNTFSSGRALYEWPNCPASCTAFAYPGSNSKAGGRALKWMIADTILLVWGYASTMVHLTSPTRALWARAKSSYNGTARARLPRWLDTTLVVTWHFVGSHLFDVLFQTTWFAVGVQNLLWDWDWGQMNVQNPTLYSAPGFSCAAQKSGETEWGFGQIFPLFMLALPLMTFAEVYEEYNEKEETPKPKPSADGMSLMSLGDSSPHQAVSQPPLDSTRLNITPPKRLQIAEAP